MSNEEKPRFRIGDHSGMQGVTLSRYATYGALKRKVSALRAKVSAYDLETDAMKRKAEREGGAAARFAVDSARSPRFHILREQLRQAEADFAAWKFPPKEQTSDQPFSSMVKAALGRRR